MKTKIDKLESELKGIESAKGQKDKDLIPVLEKLAYQLHSDGQFEYAADCYRRSLDIRQECLVEDSQGLLFVYHSLGILLRIQNKFDQSEVYYRKALKITMECFGDNHMRCKQLHPVH